jgi:maleamate amidohydrolase
MGSMKEWFDIVPEEERRVYDAGGFMRTEEIGSRLALLVIDVTYGFTGSRGLSLDAAMKEYAAACGPVAWKAMPSIADLISCCRRGGHQIVFTRPNSKDDRFLGRATKNSNVGARNERFDEFPDDIAPAADEWILEKPKASAFFQTPLMIYLVRNRVDTVVACGVSTSGCVRATVVDSFSNGFRTFVIDDCCFDRSQFSHATSLFDMNAKYATVLSLSEFKAAVNKRRETTR